MANGSCFLFAAILKKYNHSRWPVHYLQSHTDYAFLQWPLFLPSAQPGHKDEPEQWLLFWE